MTRLLAIVTALLLACLAATAFAGTATITWTAPTANTDGSALAPSAITGYDLCSGFSASVVDASGNCSGTLTSVGSVLTTTLTVTNPAAGGTLLVAVRTRGTNGVNSAWTAPVSQVFPSTLKPNPPGAVTITVIVADNSALTFEKQADRLAFLAVGTVPLGTPCDVSQPVGPYFVIPRAAVSWFGTVQPPLVVAKCSISG